MATTTNFGWDTPDDTDLVKDGAAAIRTALDGVDTSFVDLLGGTTGQLLSKNSDTDLDFTWSAAPSGGAGDIALIASGTCSGASVSLTSLSSYTELYLMISAVTNSTASGRMYLRINGNTGSNYVQTTMTMPASGTHNEYGNYTDTQAWVAGTNNVANTDSQNAFYVSLQNCKNAGFTNYEVQSAYYTSPGGVAQRELTGGIYKVAETVSSISFYNVGGNFSAGSYQLWGA